MPSLGYFLHTRNFPEKLFAVGQPIQTYNKKLPQSGSFLVTRTGIEPMLPP